MISKELLAKVLPKTEGVDIGRKEELYIELPFLYFTSFDGMSTRINIYELAHRCKEWAKLNGYWIDSNLGFVSIGQNGQQQRLRAFNGRDLKIDEPNLIFKACQWILGNKKEIKR